MTPAQTQIRRKHLKSRDGCLQCKRRKIKCDENGAVACRPCTKSRHVCSFAAPTITPTPPPAAPVVSTFSATTLLDLELLHNFSVKTAKSLADKIEIQCFFSIDFVQLALGYDYLLHSILALSALHIAHERESDLNAQPQVSEELTEKYLLAAYLHHDIALKSYRQSLSDVNPQSCHPIFGCACLLFMIALARPREIGYKASQLAPSTLTGLGFDALLSEWIILVHGIPSILSHKESLSSLRQGPMAILLKSRDNFSTAGGDHETMDAMVVTYLSSLSEAFREHSDLKVFKLCQSSIEKLHDALSGHSRSRDAVLAFTWPLLVDPDYFGLLGQKNSEALLVFACYCVLLHSISSRWWIKDWPRTILKYVKALLEDRWMPWLEWPLETVFREQESI
jgi:hypothetical protein